MERKINLVEQGHNLSIRRQSLLLAIPRNRLYYLPKGESPENLELMRFIDRIVTEEPSFGILRIQDALRDIGVFANVKRIRRLARKMGIEAIYPKRNLSKLGKARYIHPYLLRTYNSIAPNDVWAIDITYIPMSKGFMYLTGVIDHYSRYLVGWSLHNTLEKETQTDLMTDLIVQYGKPNIINSDQGSQYTSANWVDYLDGNEIRISMDGKGRATDNAYIERFFRSLKWDHIYLYPTNDCIELYKGIERFINKYNNRSHQGIGRVKPSSLFTSC